VGKKRLKLSRLEKSLLSDSVRENLCNNSKPITDGSFEAKISRLSHDLTLFVTFYDFLTGHFKKT